MNSVIVAEIKYCILWVKQQAAPCLIFKTLNTTKTWHIRLKDSWEASKVSWGPW